MILLCEELYCKKILWNEVMWTHPFWFCGNSILVGTTFNNAIHYSCITLPIVIRSCISGVSKIGFIELLWGTETNEKMTSFIIWNYGWKFRYLTFFIHYALLPAKIILIHYSLIFLDSLIMCSLTISLWLTIYIFSILKCINQWKILAIAPKGSKECR